MRQYNLQYDTPQSLVAWINSCDILSSNSVLIQIFSGVLEVERVKGMIKIITDIIPQATIVGCATSGEILNGHMQEEKMIIAMSLFDKTKLKSAHIISDDSEMMGREVGSRIIDEDTKCVIMFTDGLKTNGDAILRGINGVCSTEIVVSGGMSGDNENFSKSYCIYGNEVFEGGVVAVSLSNRTLEIFHSYSLSWKPIGKTMVVTKSKENIIFELDNQPVKDVYAKYLGENVVKRMPHSTIEFPLISHQGGVDIARSMVSLSDNEGIVYAGNLLEGTKVRFGIGSPNMVNDYAHKSYDLACKSPIEGLFIYSCVGRKAFLEKGLEAEFRPLATIAPLAGFFTYGEFYHGSDGNKLLNVTSTVLGLSENSTISCTSNYPKDEVSLSSLTVNALMNLVEVTMDENEEYANNLKLKNSALNASANGIVITNIDGVIEWANEAYRQLSGYSNEEIIGHKHNELMHSNVHDKKFFQLMWNTILSNQVWHGEVVNRHKDGHLYNEEMTITPMLDKDGNITNFVAVKQNIDERKKMEKLIRQYAFYDTLTKLPNRRLLSDRLTQVQAIRKRSKKYAAVLFLDLDNFKPLNDTHGHTMGDLLLVEVSHRLSACVRDSDTVARFGGDEFIVLLNELSVNEEEAREEATAIAEKIRRVIAQSYFLALQTQDEQDKILEYNCTSSIGITLIFENDDNQDEIIKRADSAMYKSKEAGRDQVSLA